MMSATWMINIVEIVKRREKMIETLSVFQWSILMI